MKNGVIIFLFFFICCCGNKEAQINNIDPDIVILEKKAYEYHNNRNYNQCIKYFSELIKIDSTNGDYYFKRAFSYARIDDLDNSTEDYHRSILLNFRVSDSYYNIGLNYTIKFDDSTALEYFEKAHKANPADIEIMNELNSCKLRLNSKINL